jgi:hypothetical protein
MIQAAPLVLSFARAVPMLNRLVGAVGITELGDRVNNYIQENPEESAKIVSMIMPAQGIANALKNKSSEDVEEVEETEEVTTGSGVEERIREILREAGVEDADNQDLTDLPKDLEAKVMSGIAKSSTNKQEDMKEASLIIGLRGPGKERKEMIDDVSDRYDEGGVEEVTRPKYEGYKKFIRRRRADGGAIGIEVLFEEKKPRKNFNTGGTTYDPRASAVDYATALNKVGAGTQAQKRQSLSDYLGNVISTQAQKIGNAAVIPLQAAKGVLGIQGTPITDSMQTSLQNIIQKQIKDSGKLSGNINYKDYGVKTNTQGNEFLGFGDRSFTDPEAALATTLGQASYSVDPKTGKITFTGGTAYDFGDDQFGGLGKFISKGGAFNQLPSASNKFQPGATEYNPDITLGSDFMKQFNQPKYPDYKTAALQSQYYKNNPSSLDSDLFRAAYARAVPDSGIKTRITKEGQVYTDYGNYDPSRVYSAYMSNRGTSSSNPFFDQFKGSQYAEMPAIMKAMYGDPGNLNPYYADGGRVGLFMGGPALEGQALNIYNSMNAYGFSDQEIANALQGQGLYTPPGSDAEPPTTIQPVGFQTGSDNFSPYNPDPNKIQSFKTDPRIAAANEADVRTKQLTSMGINDPFANEASLSGAYYGDMPEDTSNQIGKQSMFAKAKQGLTGLMDNPLVNLISSSTPFGMVKNLAKGIGSKLPVNQRAIQENVMGNLGFAVNDIGQIVSTGDYDDESGDNVMAGYNLNRMTVDTFKNRIDKIRNRKAAQTAASRARIAAIQEAQRKFELGQKLKADALLEAQLKKAQQEIAAKGYQDYGQGGADQATQDSYEGSDGSYAGASTQDYGGGEKDGGIIGYRKGGLATMFVEKR